MFYRFILLALAALISLTPAGAQSTKPAMNKTTGAISRLKAYAKIDGYTGSTVRFRDSIHYFYSGDNGWDELAKEWKYDSLYLYVRALNDTYSLKTRQFQSIGSNINSNVKADFYSVDNKFIDKERKSYKYNAGQLSELLTERYNYIAQTWYTNNKVVFYYDAKNRLTDSLVLVPSSGGNWDSSELVQYTYGPDGKTSWKYIALRQGWKISDTFIYSNGRLTESLQDSAYRTVYNYYPNSKNISEKIVSYFMKNTSTWKHLLKTSLMYDANDRITSVKEEGGYSYNDTVRTSFEYNRYNQLTYLKFERWYKQSWYLFDSSLYYYYEEVFPSSIEKVNKNFSAVNLYPVPATNLLTIDIMQQQASEVIFSIYTIDGKILRQWNQPVTSKEYKETISIADLPTGNYILKASSNKGEISKQFTVAR